MNLELISSFFSQTWVWIFIFLGLLLSLAEPILRKKWNLSVAIRVIWIVALGFILADWTSVRPKELSQAQTLRVFVDQSDSIVRIPDRKSRMIETVKEIKDWSKSHSQPVEFLSFGDEIKPFDEGRDRGSLVTRISPLDELLAKRKVEGGVNLLVSDGLWMDDLSPQSPLLALQLGEPSKEKDIWIDELQSVSTAFLKNRLRIPVSIAQKGFEGKEVEVQLLSPSGEVVDQKKISLDQAVNPVELTYFPDRMGEQFLGVRLESLDGEISTINNQAPIRVRVVRDKIRVLHICGKPSADLKAWRSFLTRQPDVDLVSFYILRSLDDEPQAKNSELSLIPFPYEELFSTELERFDVVILQNFDFNLYFQPFYLVNLARFVEEGGSLLMVGGDQGFHRYEGSPLEPIVPYEYPIGGSSFLETGKYKIRFKEKTLITQGLESAFQIPEWTARHSIKPRARATTAIEFLDSSPFLSFWDFEKGRVFAINSDESWKIQMEPQVQPREAFSKFARRVFQYLTFDPEMDAHPIFSNAWKVGEKAKLEWNIPAALKAVWKIEPDSLFGLPRVASRPEEILSGSPVEYLVDEPGIYKVEVGDEARSLKGNERRFVTEEEPWRSEWRKLISDDNKMKKLAESSQGKFFHYSQRSKIFDEQLSGRQILSADVQSLLRASPGAALLAFLIFAFMLGLDLFLRKRSFWDG